MSFYVGLSVMICSVKIFELIFSVNNIQIHFKKLINLHVKIKTPKLKCKYEVQKRDMKDTFSGTETIVQMES